MDTQACIGDDRAMTSRRWVIFGGGLVLLGAGLSRLISYFVTQGLERVSWWAAVISLFASTAGLIVAVLAWRRPVGVSDVGGDLAKAAAGPSEQVEAAAEQPTEPSPGHTTTSGAGAVGWAMGSTVITGDHNMVERSRNDHP